jgi:hypothetical protein
VLLPYLVLRRWGAPKRPADRRWLRFLGSRWVAGALALAALALTALFFFGGGLPEFAAMLKTNQFAFLMSCDFIACTVAGLLLAVEDARVRPAASPGWWAIGSVIGAALRLAVTPLCG